MAADNDRDEPKETDALWGLLGSHGDDHDEALQQALADVRENLTQGQPSLRRERIDAWHAIRGPVRVLFDDHTDVGRQRWLHYGVWTFPGRSADHLEELRDVLQRTGTGCAAHYTPVRISADGTVFDKEDPTCPQNAAEGIVLDMVCRWTDRHETVALPFVDNGNGSQSIGEPEPMDLDVSVLADLMPTDPGARRRRGRRQQQMLTLAELNEREPDKNHYDSTVGTMVADYHVSEHLRAWRREPVPVSQIDPIQLIDDPNDTEGEAKVEAIRQAIREGATMPAVITSHHPDAEYPYYLVEGRHRYNAAHREATPTIPSWVAHIGCCSGPVPDLA